MLIFKCQIDCVGFIFHAKKPDLSMRLKAPSLKPKRVFGVRAVFPKCTLAMAVREKWGQIIKISPLKPVTYRELEAARV